jgi:hypothetical protein
MAGCTCLEVWGEDPNCAQHGVEATKKHPDYARGHDHAAKGQEADPAGSWWYYEGYERAKEG